MHHAGLFILSPGTFPAGDVDEMIFADEEYSVSQR